MRTTGTLLLLAACASGAGGRIAEPPPPRPAAEVWLTTASGDKRLSREADAPIVEGTPTAGIVLAVDEGTRHQEIVGFGASLTDASAWLIQAKLAPAARRALLQELFGRDSGGLGFSFTRVDMGGSDFARAHYTYDDVPAGQADPTLAHFSIAPDRAETIPILREALAINPSLKVMGTPWSAPAWMKTSGSLVKGALRPEAYGPYADYFLKFVRAYEAEGIPVYAISIQNEPHFEPDDYPGMRVEPPSRAAFIGGHLGPLFEREGITTRILDWDHNWDQPQSPLAVLGDAAARKYVAGVAWHCYAGDVSAQAQVHAAHPDKETWFTECSGGGWSPKFGENLAWQTRHLIIGTTRGWAKGVLFWNLALDERHGPHLGGCGDCRGVVTIDGTTGEVTRNVEYYVLGHASRFVRPGARRIESTSGVEGLESVAFRNADDGSKVLLVLNTASADRPFAVRAGTRTFSCTLPAGAVVTLRWQ